MTPRRPQEIRLRQRAVLAADLNALADQLAALDKQIAQKEATRQRLDMSIAFQNDLMVTLNDRVKTRQDAIKLKVGTKINLYDAQEALQKSQSQLASDQGELIETQAALNELRSEKFKALSQFIADNENKSADAARRAEDAKQALSKAAAKLTRTRLVAPIDGVAQQLAVTTIGQVVTTGQKLLVVTPKEGPLLVEALVANIDVGFVKVGQTAVIKVDAFPFTRFGALSGKVVAHRRRGGRRDRGQARARRPHFALELASAADQRAGTAGKLRLPGRDRARRDHDEDRRQPDRAQPRDDGDGGDHHRQPPRHRISPVAAGKDRFGGDARALASPSTATCHRGPVRLSQRRNERNLRRGALDAWRKF